MLLFLYGQNVYGITEKLRAIEGRYRDVHGSGLNLEKIDSGAMAFQDFFDIFNQQSMFVKKKLFFLENVFSNEQFKTAFCKQIKALAESQNIVVVIERDKIKKADKLFRALQKHAQCQHFETLTGQKLRTWARQKFAGLGCDIRPMALDKLLACVGSDIWRLDNEIKKLSAYSKQINVEAVDMFIQPSFSPEIFKTIDALAEGNKKRALQLLEAHLQKGDSPFYLLTMVAYQFRNILLVKSGKKSGMHPFVLRKTTALASRFSFDELKRIFQQIFQTDLAIKTGKLAPAQGLRSFVVEA